MWLNCGWNISPSPTTEYPGLHITIPQFSPLYTSLSPLRQTLGPALSPGVCLADQYNAHEPPIGPPRLIVALRCQGRKKKGKRQGPISLFTFLDAKEIEPAFGYVWKLLFCFSSRAFLCEVSKTCAWAGNARAVSVCPGYLHILKGCIPFAVFSV